ncbi:MAG: hypothetical protein ACREXR_09980, partial [Gammaproteobacteria bacterium]
ALRTNRHYVMTATGGGRFQALRHNRIHADPLRPETATVDRQKLASSSHLNDPVMLLFHSFYPADDGARRTNNGTGTNREFHHLAVGLLFPAARETRRLAAEALRRNGLLFVSRSPTEAQVIPLLHPSLLLVDDAGRESTEGSHPVIFANTLMIQGYTLSGDNVNKDRLAENGKEGADYNPDDWQWWAGLGSAVAVGALIGAAGGPIGGVCPT